MNCKLSAKILFTIYLKLKRQSNTVFVKYMQESLSEFCMSEK